MLLCAEYRMCGSGATGGYRRAALTVLTDVHARFRRAAKLPLSKTDDPLQCVCFGLFYFGVFAAPRLKH